MRAVYIDHMGSDLSVVNAARVSFDKVSDWEVFEAESEPDSFLGYTLPLAVKRLSERDAKLISFLARHNHWTPFAHTGITLRMAAPVPVRTQCFKHKAGFVENEESRRYIKSEPTLYVPEVWRKAPEGSAKQGSGGLFGLVMRELFTSEYRKITGYAVQKYLQWVEQDGMCPEQARFILPQGVEVNWIWTGNLASFARFYKQRTDPHAQQEIQELAREVGEIIRPLFPVSWEALTK